jgi:hypothetical protein
VIAEMVRAGSDRKLINFANATCDIASARYVVLPLKQMKDVLIFGRKGLEIIAPFEALPNSSYFDKIHTV